MKVRVYCEVLEQGEFFKEAIPVDEAKIEIVLLKGGEIKKYIDESLVSSLYSIKNFDLMVTIVNNEKEIPLVVVEFSTAVQTDDHELQRADILKWSGKFRIPYLKISPVNKLSLTAGKNHGGSNMITIFDQKVLSYLNGGIMFHVSWPLKKTKYSTDNHKNYPSCPKNIEKVNILISNLLTCFKGSKDRFDYINNLREKQIIEFRTLSKGDYSIEILSRFSNSRRIRYDLEKKSLIIKINRYGHGMDPEKGMLAFWKLALPKDWIISAEFQVERERLQGRLSYKSNFEGTPLWRGKEKEEFISTVKHKKKLTPEQMIKFHSIASTSKNIQYELISRNTYKMKDETLRSFLSKGKLFTAYKGVLYYSDQINLLDKDFNTVVKIKWDKSVVDEHFDIGTSDPSSYTKPIELEEINFNLVGEDIITWLTKKILEYNGFEILVVSYPGAQGDKPILYGPSGKSVRRMYVDIIAYKKETQELLLIESKDSLSKSLRDLEKLSSIVNEYTKELKLFLQSVSCDYNALRFLRIGVVGRAANQPIGLSLVDFVISMELKKDMIYVEFDGIDLTSGSFRVTDIPALKIK